MFNELRTSAKSFNEKNDCSVIAIAAATGCTYSDAHDAMRTAGRKPRKGAKNHQILAALESLGFTYSEHSIESLQTHYPKKNKPKTITPSQVRQYPHIWQNDKTYLFFTNYHVLTVKNGDVIDWTDGRCHRVNYVVEVHGKRFQQPEKQLMLF